MQMLTLYMGVSKKNGTPKSSILMGFSIINHPFWGTPIFGNTHICFRWSKVFDNISASLQQLLSWDSATHSWIFWGTLSLESALLTDWSSETLEMMLGVGFDVTCF